MEEEEEGEEEGEEEEEEESWGEEGGVRWGEGGRGRDGRHAGAPFYPIHLNVAMATDRP